MAKVIQMKANTKKTISQRDPKMDSLTSENMKSIQKVAMYSGGGSTAMYRDGGKKLVNPVDSVIKYSDKLKKTSAEISKLKKKK